MARLSMPVSTCNSSSVQILSAFRTLSGRPERPRLLRVLSEKRRPTSRQFYKEGHCSILILSPHIRLGLHMGFFPVGLPVKILRGPLPSFILAT